MRNKIFVRAVCFVLAAVMVLGLLLYGVGSFSALAISQADIDALEDERQAIRDQQQLVIEQMDALEADHPVKAALNEMLLHCARQIGPLGQAETALTALREVEQL